MAEETSYVDYMRVADLPVADVNPKKHELDAIKDSIKRFGFVSPLVLNEATGKLLAGHGRREALLLLMGEKDAKLPSRVIADEDGEWMVPVLRGVRFDNEADARAYLLADNRLTEIGGWDTEQLLAELKGINDDGGLDALVGVGWSDKELEKLLGDQETFAEGKNSIKDPVETNRFVDAAIKQVSFFYAADEYDRVVEGLDRLGSSLGLENHSDVIKALVDKAVADLPALEVLVDEEEEGQE